MPECEPFTDGDYCCAGRGRVVRDLWVDVDELVHVAEPDGTPLLRREY